MAIFLENGHCYFYDKKRGKNVEQIMVEKWESGLPEVLMGESGRSFYLDENTLFVQITDWKN